MSHSRSNHSDIFINYDHQLNEIIDPRIQADAQRIAKRISAKPGSRPSNGFMAFKHHRSEDPQSRDPLKAGEDWNNLSASEKQKWDSVYEASKRPHPRTQSKSARESASPSAHRSKRPQSSRHSQADRSSHRLENHSGTPTDHSSFSPSHYPMPAMQETSHSSWGPSASYNDASAFNYGGAMNPPFHNPYTGAVVTPSASQSGWPSYSNPSAAFYPAQGGMSAHGTTPSAFTPEYGYYEQEQSGFNHSSHHTFTPSPTHYPNTAPHYPPYHSSGEAMNRQGQWGEHAYKQRGPSGGHHAGGWQG